MQLVGGLMLTLLIVPLLLMVPPKADQPAALFTLLFCRSTNPEGDGQETITLVPDRVMVRLGAPGVCAMEMRDQKPPVSEKLPPLIAGPPSGWPMVPLTE